MNRHVRSHERRRRDNASYMCTLCSMEFLHQNELRHHARRQHAGEGTSSAQSENNNGARLVCEPLLTSSDGENAAETPFHSIFSQLSVDRIFALFSEAYKTALSNLNQSCFDSNSTNENEQPLVSNFTLFIKKEPSSFKRT